MRIFSILIFAFSFLISQAQTPINKELQFIQHLVNQEEYNDVIYYINTNFNFPFQLQIRDSLNYYTGWSYYSLKELNQSTSSFLQVSSDSPFFLKSRFFAAYNSSHLKRTAFSKYILKNLLATGNINDLKNFELAGNSLLERDFNEFNIYYAKMKHSTNFSYNIEKNKLNDYFKQIQNHKTKSPVLGVLMSTVIPGMGKIYAGKTGEGISSFIVVAASGLTAFENYKKLGFQHAKTIIFGSLFAVLYIGNIYGTIFTIKLANEEFNHEMDHKILFNMHIPLRNIFN